MSKKFKIKKVSAKKFADQMPKNEIHYLEGGHKYRGEMKHCHYAWLNGELIGIIYNIEKFLKNK